MAAPPRPRPSACLRRSLARSSSLALRSTEEEAAVPARPAHTHSHTDTRSHPRAPPLSGGAAHLIPYAGGVSHWRGFGRGGSEGGRKKRELGAGSALPEGPSHGTWGLAPVGWRGCCGGRGPRLPGADAAPPAPHSPAQAGPARGQVPSRALKITAGN